MCMLSMLRTRETNFIHRTGSILHSQSLKESSEETQECLLKPRTISFGSLKAMIRKSMIILQLIQRLIFQTLQHCKFTQEVQMSINWEKPISSMFLCHLTESKYLRLFIMGMAKIKLWEKPILNHRQIQLGYFLIRQHFS